MSGPPPGLEFFFFFLFGPAGFLIFEKPKPPIPLYFPGYLAAVILL